MLLREAGFVHDARELVAASWRFLFDRGVCLVVSTISRHYSHKLSV